MNLRNWLEEQQSEVQLVRLPAQGREVWVFPEYASSVGPRLQGLSRTRYTLRTFKSAALKEIK